MGSFVSSYPALIASRTAALKSVMVDQLAQKAPVAKPSAFNVSTSDQYNLEERSIAGFGLLQKFQSEAPANWPTADMTNRYTKTITIGHWGLRTQMTKMFIKYDRDGIVGAQKGRELVKAAVNTQEFYATDLLANMTSTATAYVMPDAVALASDSHPLLDNVLGGTATFDNYVGAALDDGTLQTAMTMFNRQVNDRGIPIMSSGRKLLLSPNLEWTVSEILNSNLTPDVANQYSPMGHAGIVPVILPFMQSTTFWAMEGENHRLDWYDGQGIETDVWRDNNDKQLNADVDCMFMFGAFDWRDFIGGFI